MKPVVFGLTVGLDALPGGERILHRDGAYVETPARRSYMNVGTLDGYRSAMQWLDLPEPREGEASQIAEPLGRSPAQPLAP